MLRGAGPLIGITLDIYSHLLPDIQETAAKALEEALRRSDNGLLHGCCTDRRRSPSSIGACKQRNYATWALMLQFCPSAFHRSDLHGGACLSTPAICGEEAPRRIIM